MSSTSGPLVSKQRKLSLQFSVEKSLDICKLVKMVTLRHVLEETGICTLTCQKFEKYWWSVLVLYCFCNRLPHILWLTLTLIFSLTVFVGQKSGYNLAQPILCLEPHRLKSRCVVERIQFLAVSCRAYFPIFSPPCQPGVIVSARGCLHSLARGLSLGHKQ